MVSFIHTADVHLDAPLASMASLYEIRQHDFRETMQRIRGLVSDKQVDFWLIAGDLMEYHGGTRATALFLMELFASVSPTPVLISPGNHDPWMEGSYYQSIEWSSNVYFFTPEWGAYEFPEKQCVVYGWGFGQPHVTESPLATFPGKLAGFQHHIMVIHGTVLSQDEWGHQPYAPIALQELQSLSMDYVALGHIHKAHQFIHPQRKTPFAAYPGSPEGLTSKESGMRHVLFGSIQPDGEVHLDTIPVSSRQIEKVAIEVNGVDTTDALLQRIASVLHSRNKRNILEVTLEGQRASHLAIPLELLREQYREYFSINFRDCTFPDIDVEQLISENQLLGRWLRRLQSAIDQSASDMDKEIAEIALQEAVRRIGGTIR